MNPGDIVLIRFPQADLQAGKLRPALVVAVAPGRYENVLLALITSRTYQAIPEFDEVIDPSDADYEASGLKAASVVRPARLASIESAVTNARLGKIAPERMQQIVARPVDWLQASAEG